MSFTQATLLLGALALLPGVLAHSFIDCVMVDGKCVKGTGYGKLSHTDSIGWPAPGNEDSGPVFPDRFNHPDIICNMDARPGPKSQPYKAGDQVVTTWGPWPADHMGPIMCYMAKCNGKCSEAKKEELRWFKTSEEGLIGTNPNRWAANKFLENGRTWECPIPETIAKGEYVMRIELWAIQGAHVLNGAQAYPWCINLDVDSEGTDNPAGVVGTKLYTPRDPGILVDITKPIQSYAIPGPPVYRPGSSDLQSPVQSPSNNSTGSTAPSGYGEPVEEEPVEEPASEDTASTADAAPTNEGDCSEKTTTITATVTVTAAPSPATSSSVQQAVRPTAATRRQREYYA